MQSFCSAPTSKLPTKSWETAVCDRSPEPNHQYKHDLLLRKQSSFEGFSSRPPNQNGLHHDCLSTMDSRYIIANSPQAIMVKNVIPKTTESCITDYLDSIPSLKTVSSSKITRNGRFCVLVNQKENFLPISLHQKISQRGSQSYQSPTARNLWQKLSSAESLTSGFGKNPIPQDGIPNPQVRPYLTTSMRHRSNLDFQLPSGAKISERRQPLINEVLLGAKGLPRPPGFRLPNTVNLRKTKSEFTAHARNPKGKRVAASKCSIASRVNMYGCSKEIVLDSKMNRHQADQVSRRIETIISATKQKKNTPLSEFGVTDTSTHKACKINSYQISTSFPLEEAVVFNPMCGAPIVTVEERNLSIASSSYVIPMDCSWFTQSELEDSFQMEESAAWPWVCKSPIVTVDEQQLTNIISLRVMPVDLWSFDGCEIYANAPLENSADWNRVCGSPIATAQQPRPTNAISLRVLPSDFWSLDGFETDSPICTTFSYRNPGMVHIGDFSYIEDYRTLMPATKTFIIPACEVPARLHSTHSEAGELIHCSRMENVVQRAPDKTLSHTELDMLLQWKSNFDHMASVMKTAYLSENRQFSTLHQIRNENLRRQIGLNSDPCSDELRTEYEATLPSLMNYRDEHVLTHEAKQYMRICESQSTCEETPEQSTGQFLGHPLLNCCKEQTISLDGRSINEQLTDLDKNALRTMPEISSHWTESEYGNKTDSTITNGMSTIVIVAESHELNMTNGIQPMTQKLRNA